MPRQVDEPITVALSPEGEPRRFVWRRFEYEVIGVPQSFFRRTRWWQQPAVRLARIDRELWRVEATSTGDMADVRTYDLASGPDGEGWRLALEWE